MAGNPLWASTVMPREVVSVPMAQCVGTEVPPTVHTDGSPQAVGVNCHATATGFTGNARRG